MDIKIPYITATDSELAYKKVASHLSGEGLPGLPIKPALNFDPVAKKISAKGKGFSVDATFHDNHMKLELELSLLYSAFKGKIITVLEEQLKKYL